MSRDEMLNNIDHKDLRILTQHSAEYGDAVMTVFTFPNEFRNIQAHYPILFQKAPDTGKFYAVALLGFEKGENLFLTDEGWDCSYIPLMLEKEPFAIGRQTNAQTGEESGVITVNMDHPRVSKTEDGDAVFLEFGGNSDYLERITSLLDQAHDGHLVNDTFMQSLLQHDLLEPLNLEVTLGDGSINNLAGFYIINEENLSALPADVTVEMAQSGALEVIYMAMASLSQVQGLVNRKNAKLE